MLNVLTTIKKKVTRAQINPAQSLIHSSFAEMRRKKMNDVSHVWLYNSEEYTMSQYVTKE